ncbi:SDR family oxidoreductase [Phyllobacterium sp. 21LDTY02-6]|uniref:SDR family NAD(P)-dependent oxidoreductase n=1 Tax=Phyllobacterium sp. 21LDTY02-6 TaxID=2944903 RepID=UPI0020224C9F|nr:SDR family NAD(P)-dependent oxidoreductase [Phyllobacterium sp. 21LDTY02-6]MCO4318216.1 SDR family oxidoreductase [Phyllobacterium sp. 21LDTY02-6]
MDRDSVIIVTGGASGIGRAVVEAVLGRGARVVIVDRDEAALERCRAELGAGPALMTACIDIADEEAVVESVARWETFGRISGLVNSAGIARDVPAFETDLATFRKIVDVNLVGSFLLCREAGKAMRHHGGGSIVNIASVSGIKGNRGRVAYGASKGGVLTMTKVLAVEWAAHGIRVNAIAPGPIETPLVQVVHTPEVREAWMNTVPQRRYGMPEDIAGAAMFLLDGSQSGFITGQTLSVDGGFTIAGLLA